MIIILFHAVCAIFSILSVVQGYSPPTGNKFFFAQLDYGKQQSFVKFEIGSERQEMNLMLNSEELTVALFTKNCTTTFEGADNICNVRNPYDTLADKDK